MVRAASFTKKALSDVRGREPGKGWGFTVSKGYEAMPDAATTTCRGWWWSDTLRHCTSPPHPGPPWPTLHLVCGARIRSGLGSGPHAGLCGCVVLCVVEGGVRIFGDIHTHPSEEAGGQVPGLIGLVFGCLDSVKYPDIHPSNKLPLW